MQTVRTLRKMMSIDGAPLRSSFTCVNQLWLRGVSRGVQAAFFKIKSSLKPNHVVKYFSSQASNQIAVPKNCQIKPQIKSGSSNFHQIKSQIKPPAYEFSQIKSQIKSQPQNFRQIKSQIT